MATKGGNNKKPANTNANANPKEPAKKPQQQEKKPEQKPADQNQKKDTGASEQPKKVTGNQGNQKTGNQNQGNQKGGNQNQGNQKAASANKQDAEKKDVSEVKDATSNGNEDGKGQGDRRGNRGGGRGKGEQGKNEENKGEEVEEVSPERKKIDQLTEQIDKTYRALEEIKIKMNDLDNEGRQVREKRDNHMKTKRNNAEKRRQVQQDAKDRTTGLLETKNKMDRKRAQAQTILEKLPVKDHKGDLAAANMKYIDNQISLLQKQVAKCKTQGDDKKFMNEIKNWSGKKNLVKQYEELMKTVQNEERGLGELEQIRKESDGQISAILKEEEKFADKLASIDKQQNEIREKLPPLKKQREQLRDQLTKLKEERSKVFDSLRAKQSEVRKIEAQRRKQKQEQMQKRRDEKRKRELEKPPFLEDIHICNQVLKGLNNLKRPQVAEGEEEPKLLLSFPALLQFEQLSLAPPAAFKDVESAIQRVLARRSYLAELSNEKMIERGLQPAFAEDGTRLGQKKDEKEKVGKKEGGRRRAKKDKDQEDEEDEEGEEESDEKSEEEEKGKGKGGEKSEEEKEKDDEKSESDSEGEEKKD